MSVSRPLASSECECRACLCVFSSETTFDRHQRDGRCLDPVSAVNKKGAPIFEPRERRHGITWVLAGSNPYAKEAMS